MRYLREREPWKRKLKRKLGHFSNYRRNEVTFTEGPSYHIHCHVVYLCENHSVSTDEVENDLHDLWNEACRRNSFRWSKKGVGVNVREGENVGIYGLKKEHTLEDFKRVKKMLEESNKRINNHFLKNESLSVGDLERQIYFNNLVNHKTIENIYFYLDCLNSFKFFNGKKYIV